MADFLVRNIPEHVLERLRERAARNGRSLQAEVQATLAASVKPSREEWLARLRAHDAMFEGRFPEGTAVELIRETRDER